MDILENRNNWTVETIRMGSAVDGVRELSAIIVLSQQIDTPFGKLRERLAFEVEHGEQYVGNFGNNPVYVGKADDIYFSGLHQFDGIWHLTDSVTPKSGEDILYKALLEFAEEHGMVD